MLLVLAAVAAADYGYPRRKDVTSSAPTLYVCQNGQCVPSSRGLPLSECEVVCMAPLNYTCQSGRCVAGSRGLPKADCAQICGGPPPPPSPPPMPPPTPPSDTEVAIAPGVMMPYVNLGFLGSDPKIAIPAWFTAGGVGIDIED